MSVKEVYDESGPKVPDNADHDRPHACLEGWVFITYEDDHGEEREAFYRCGRCAGEAR